MNPRSAYPGLAQRIRQVIERREGEPLARLAEQLDVDVSTVRRWMDGTREPSLLNLARLAEVLGVSTDYLLGRD